MDPVKRDQRTKVKQKISFQTGKGLDERTIKAISKAKDEPGWMLEKRLKAYRLFLSKPMPSWGPDLSDIDLDKITFYLRPDTKKTASWDEVPKGIKKVYDRLGIPEAEKKFLAGVAGQFESEIFYSKIREELSAKGVIFTDTDTAVKEYPDLIKEYFMTKCVPVGDNKFSALHGAVWSGGSFLYVPKGVSVELPLHTYFRMNEGASGQFEHTIIIADEGASVHYIEGCTAPIRSENSLHSAVVEIFVKKNASVKYSTIQNWSGNVDNLNTKRAMVYENGSMEWVGGSLGSRKTMLYPASFLMEKGAKSRHTNITLAGKGQWKDTGAKVIHFAPDTHSQVISKSIAKAGGRTSYRGLIKIMKGATGASSHVQCDALMIDSKSRSDTYPYVNVYEPTARVGHEARVGRIGEEEIFYLSTRGMKQAEAMSLIVAGFLDPIIKALPMEYALELNRLIEMEMEGSVG